ncbi:hypothetical protein D3C81_1460240 [compost metagenome]
MGQACLVHDTPAALEVDLPCLGQLDAPGSSVQKPQANRLLQLRDTPRDSGVRDAQAFTRIAEAFHFDHFHEEGHVIEVLHTIAPSADQYYPDYRIYPI